MSEKAPTIEKQRTKSPKEVAEQVGRISFKLAQRAEKAAETKHASGDIAHSLTKIEDDSGVYTIATSAQNKGQYSAGKVAESRSVRISGSPAKGTDKNLRAITTRELDGSHGSTELYRGASYNAPRPSVRHANSINGYSGNVEGELVSEHSHLVENTVVNEADQVRTNDPERVTADSARILSDIRGHIAKAEIQRKQ